MKNFCRVPWQDYKTWRDYGIENGYEQRNPASLSQSKDPKEKSWYVKGISMGWNRKFHHKRKSDIFPTLSKWKEIGVERGYEMRNPTSLFKSDKKEDRSWYHKGYGQGWTTHFRFSRILQKSETHFNNLLEWKQYGISNGYNKKNPRSLIDSDDLEERSWYNRGRRRGWLKDFPFVRLKDRMINSQEKLEQFLKETPEAMEIASLAATNGYVSDAADMLVKLWPERFVKASQLARSLPGAIGRIGHALKPFSFGKAERFKERTRTLPSKIQYELEDILFSIARDQYQKRFNKNPKKILEEIESFASNTKIKPLVSKVLQYYQKIYSFKIPGYGSLEQNS